MDDTPTIQGHTGRSMTDPGERRDLAAERPQQAQAMRAALAKVLDDERKARPAGASGPSPSQELIERLGALGYVGMSLCYFFALERISAGLTVLLLYFYPAAMTPGCTTARRFATSISRMRAMRANDTTTPPSTGIAPPERPVPAPRGTMGTRCS